MFSWVNTVNLFVFMLLSCSVESVIQFSFKLLRGSVELVIKFSFKLASCLVIFVVQFSLVVLLSWVVCQLLSLLLSDLVVWLN